MLRFHFCFACFLFLCGSLLQLRAQEVTISSPMKITPGLSKVEVLGKTGQGILIRHTVKDEEEILAYYDNMQLHWKKSIPRHDKNAKTEEVIVYPDSVWFFYSSVSKGVTTLKSFKTNARIESPGPTIICDTLSRNLLNPAPHPQFTMTPDKQFVLCWYEDANFENNNIVHLLCFNDRMKKAWSLNLQISGFENPDVLTAVLDSAGNACLVSGDYKVRNLNNDFPYTSYIIYTIKEKGRQIHQSTIQEKDFFFSAGTAKPDMRTGNVIIAGMYSHNIGTESAGMFLFTYSTSADSLVVRHYETYTADFITQLTGNNPPRRNDGFFDFHAKDLIVKRDGGVLFIAQSESVSTEAYVNPPLGGFGLSTGFTVNYFHYDELAVLSYNQDGSVEWKQILHKKQATEGDGGFFSSIGLMIAPTQLYFVFNDGINGQTVVTDFSLDATGVQSRKEIFSADRKGVMVVPRQGKQVSANEMVLPSFKKNFLQFVKISF